MAKRHPKPTAEQNVGRALRKAAQVLSDRKWTQKTLGHPNVGMCTAGVIRFALTGKVETCYSSAQATWAWRVESEFADWLTQNGYATEDNIPIWTIAGWNDAEGRTKEEVILYMRKFADEMDPQSV